MSGRVQLRRLRRALQAGRPVPADVARDLVERLRAFESGQPFDVAMGLRVDSDLRQLRNECLSRAAAALPDHLTTADRARQILRAARRLEPHICNVKADAGLSTFERHVIHALRIADLPAERTLARVCQKPEMAETDIV